MPNVLVIGNGFDLYHELPTRYIDFVNYTKKVSDGKKHCDSKIEEICTNNVFIKYFQAVARDNHGWIDCELEIQNIVEVIDKLLSNDGSTDGIFRKINESYFTQHEISALKIMDKFIFVDYIQKMFQIQPTYYSEFKRVDKEKFWRDMKVELNDLIFAFQYYLNYEVNKKDVTKRSPQLSNIEFDYVVNFNYTKTCGLYEKIKWENIFFIHGSASKEPNNMVLGIKDDECEKLDFVYFKKYFQRIQKLTGILNEEKFYSNIKGVMDMATTYFFGHSLSSTDGDVIRKIRKLSKQMIIYHYNQEDYEQKVINLIDIFGKEQSVEMIQTGFIKFEKII